MDHLLFPELQIILVEKICIFSDEYCAAADQL